GGPRYDPRPARAADPREGVATMGEERIHERAVGIAGCWVHHQPRRFFQHDQLRVLVADVERYRLRLGRVRHGRRERHRAALTWFDPQGGLLYGRAVHGYLACLDEMLEAGAREISEAPRQKSIEALPP